MKNQYDAIVVGSGIGGATVARNLVKLGKKVIIFEKGGNHKLLGNHLAIMRMADMKGFRYTKEGALVASGITYGGSSVISSGTAFRPPSNSFKTWGILLDKYLDLAEIETGTTILPDSQLGQGNLNLLAAGNRLGYRWEKLPKLFVDPDKCKIGCSACMMGCKHQAKFTARTLLDEGKHHGLVTQKKKIDHVIIEGNRAIGVKPNRGHSIYSNLVIVSAGGVHSPIILQKSGIENSGKSFFMDPMVFTYGVAKEKKNRTINDIPMSVGTYHFHNEGLLQSPVVDPWGLFLLTFALQRTPWNLFRIRHYPRLMGIMTKIQDQKAGHLTRGRLSLSISKPLTSQDQNRLDRGQEIAKEVLIEAGAKKNNLFSTPTRGAHPGGTNSIGEVVNPDLQTNVKNLFVCDASILPHSLGTPLILTLMAFGFRLADYIKENY
ncbi:MAG: GMC family oxidoreductase N-terminal domain-containing protein [Candidatus Hodarchaeales archaeon]